MDELQTTPSLLSNKPCVQFNEFNLPTMHPQRSDTDMPTLEHKEKIAHPKSSGAIFKR